VLGLGLELGSTPTLRLGTMHTNLSKGGERERSMRALCLRCHKSNLQVLTTLTKPFLGGAVSDLFLGRRNIFRSKKQKWLRNFFNFFQLFFFFLNQTTPTPTGAQPNSKLPSQPTPLPLLGWHKSRFSSSFDAYKITCIFFQFFFQLFFNFFSIPLPTFLQFFFPTFLQFFSIFYLFGLLTKKL
jgi:hypothetical protein